MDIVIIDRVPCAVLLHVCPSVRLSMSFQVCIMKMLRHEHVVRYFGERKVGPFLYIFLEYADGGELFDRIGMCWLCAVLMKTGF